MLADFWLIRMHRLPISMPNNILNKHKGSIYQSQIQCIILVVISVVLKTLKFDSRTHCLYCNLSQKKHLGYWWTYQLKSEHLRKALYIFILKDFITLPQMFVQTSER